jgi:putative ABC transport system substrate-binding protein
MRNAAALTFILLALAFLCPVAGHAAERVALLISADDAPYREAVGGFNEYASKQGLQPSYELINLGGDPSRAGAAIQKIKQGRYDLIFALGSLATDAVAREISDTPIVAGLVLRPESLKKGGNITGVSLEFPLELQFSWIQKVIPQARTIGVIYSPEENKKKIEAAAKVAQKMGLKLEAQEVRTPQEVPDALERLSKRAQVLWGVPDTVALTMQMAKPILLFSIRNSIPVIGPSVMWVRAGVLYSLDSDYKDVGAQCGEMVAKILRGTAPGAIPPESPRSLKYSLNMTTARQMKLSIPDDIVRGAQQTF